MHHVAAESKIMKNDDPHTQVLSAVSVCVCVSVSGFGYIYGKISMDVKWIREWTWREVNNHIDSQQKNRINHKAA